MLTRYALIGVLLAMLGLGSAMWWVMGQRDAAEAHAARLQAELDTAQHRLAQAAEAAAVHRAYIDRAQQAAQAAADAETEALTTEGANAPLPDYLRAILDRMR